MGREQRKEVVGAVLPARPGAQQAEVGGGGIDGEHDGGFADAYDAERATVECFGGVVLKVAEPSFYA